MACFSKRMGSAAGQLALADDKILTWVDAKTIATRAAGVLATFVAEERCDIQPIDGLDHPVVGHRPEFALGLHVAGIAGFQVTEACSDGHGPLSFEAYYAIEVGGCAGGGVLAF